MRDADLNGNVRNCNLLRDCNLPRDYNLTGGDEPRGAYFDNSTGRVCRDMIHAALDVNASGSKRDYRLPWWDRIVGDYDLPPDCDLPDGTRSNVVRNTTACGVTRRDDVALARYTAGVLTIVPCTDYISTLAYVIAGGLCGVHTRSLLYMHTRQRAVTTCQSVQGGDCLMRHTYRT